VEEGYTFLRMGGDYAGSLQGRAAKLGEALGFVSEYQAHRGIGKILKTGLLCRNSKG